MLAFTSLAMIPALVFFSSPSGGSSAVCRARSRAERRTRTTDRTVHAEPPRSDRDHDPTPPPSTSRPGRPRRPRVRRPARPDDARGEARAARRLLGEGATARRSRRCRASSAEAASLDEFARHGLGHLTRPYGTRPVDPVERAPRGCGRSSAAWSPGPGSASRRIVHEECLTGLAGLEGGHLPDAAGLGRGVRPRRWSSEMGAADRRLDARARHPPGPRAGARRRPRPALGPGRGVHRRGPVPRRAPSARRTCAGLQSAGVHATLKHFVGYSASRAGRNFAPVHAGPRELADVLLVPFEMAILDGGARSVMHSYAEIDGVPVAADPDLLTELLREQWGFDGTVVADYFGVAFLHLLHHVAADLGDAAAQALAAGVDVELPTGDAYLAPLAAAVRTGTVDEALVDRAVLRVLRAEGRAGAARRDVRRTSRRPARRPRLARAPRARRAGWPRSRSCCSPTTASLPLAARAPRSRSSARTPTGPRRCSAATPSSTTCSPQHPGAEPASTSPTVLRGAARRVRPGAEIAVRPRLRRRRRRPSPASRRPSRAAARATSPCSSSATRPGSSAAAPSARAATATTSSCPASSASWSRRCWRPGTPVVLVLLTGRPYAVGWALDALRRRGAGLLPRRGGRRRRSPGCSPGGSTRRAGCR